MRRSRRKGLKKCNYGFLICRPIMSYSKNIGKRIIFMHRKTIIFVHSSWTVRNRSFRLNEQIIPKWSRWKYYRPFKRKTNCMPSKRMELLCVHDRGVFVTFNVQTRAISRALIAVTECTQIAAESCNDNQPDVCCLKIFFFCRRHAMSPT